MQNYNIFLKQQNNSDFFYNFAMGKSNERNYIISDNMDISAIASYNGGLGSVKNWKSALTYKDSDEFYCVNFMPVGLFREIDERAKYVDNVLLKS